jgi:hypothetical protein
MVFVTTFDVCSHEQIKRVNVILVKSTLIGVNWYFDPLFFMIILENVMITLKRFWVYTFLSCAWSGHSLMLVDLQSHNSFAVATHWLQLWNVTPYLSHFDDEFLTHLKKRVFWFYGGLSSLTVLWWWTRSSTFSLVRNQLRKNS